MALMIFPSSSFAREWSFVKDMNYDYLITISDVWLWFKWLYFYPGDFLLSKIIYTKFGAFFELYKINYGGYFSGMCSTIFWLLTIVILQQWFIDIKTSFTESIANLPNNYAKIKNYITKEKVPLRYVLYSFLAILIVFLVNGTLGLFLLVIFALNRCFYFRYYLNSGGNFKKDINNYLKNFKISIKSSMMWLLIPISTIIIISLLAIIFSQ
jgi:hypothetical protein